MLVLHLVEFTYGFQDSIGDARLRSLKKENEENENNLHVMDDRQATIFIGQTG